jgi:hypothetical protein
MVAIASSTRLKIENAVDLFYNPQYYQKFLPSFINISFPGGYYTAMGYASIALVSVIFMFAKKKKYLHLKVGFVFLTLMLLFPIVGSVMNGLSYPSNRWVFGYSFLVSIIFAIVSPDFFSASKKQISTITVFSILYLVLCNLFTSSRVETYMFSQILFVLSTAVVLIFNLCGDKISITIKKLFDRNKNKKYILYFSKILTTKNLFKLSILSLIILSVSFNAYYLRSPFKSNAISGFYSSNSAYSAFTNNATEVIKAISDSSFYRYDENIYSGQPLTRNASIIDGLNSTNFYHSSSNKNVDQFRKELELGSPIEMSFRYIGLDNRTIPDILLNVKYFVVKNGLERYLPYGFNEKVLSAETTKGTLFDAYENKNTLPFGYTYSSYIQRDSYTNLSAIQKQNILLEAAVLDTPPQTKIC